RGPARRRDDRARRQCTKPQWSSHGPESPHGPRPAKSLSEDKECLLPFARTSGTGWEGQPITRGRAKGSVKGDGDHAGTNVRSHGPTNTLRRQNGSFGVESPRSGARAEGHPSRRRSLYPTDSRRSGLAAGTDLHAPFGSFADASRIGSA